MNRIFTKVILIASVAFTAVGCGEYSKVLKSKDQNLMYSKALEYYKAGKYDRSTQLLEDVTPYFSGTVREDSVLYYTADSYYHRGHFDTSGILFDEFRRKFGRSPFVEEAEFKYAMGLYYSSPDPKLDQTITRQAIGSLMEYLQRYPNSIQRDLCVMRIEEMKGKLHEQAYLNAKTYYNIGRYKSAVVALKNALGQYPDTHRREDILYLTTKSTYELARNSVETLQRDRYLDMMDSYYSFIAEYPDSKHRKEVDKMQAEAKLFLASHPNDGI